MDNTDKKEHRRDMVRLYSRNSTYPFAGVNKLLWENKRRAWKKLMDEK